MSWLNIPLESWVGMVFSMMAGAGIVLLGMWAQRRIDRLGK